MANGGGFLDVKEVSLGDDRSMSVSGSIQGRWQVQSVAHLQSSAASVIAGVLVALAAGQAHGIRGRAREV